MGLDKICRECTREECPETFGECFRHERVRKELMEKAGITVDPKFLGCSDLDYDDQDKPVCTAESPHYGDDFRRSQCKRCPCPVKPEVI